MSYNNLTLEGVKLNQIFGLILCSPEIYKGSIRLPTLHHIAGEHQELPQGPVREKKCNHGRDKYCYYHILILYCIYYIHPLVIKMCFSSFPRKCFLYFYVYGCSQFPFSQTAKTNVPTFMLRTCVKLDLTSNKTVASGHIPRVKPLVFALFSLSPE